MTDKTIPEIQQEYGAKASEILTTWHNTLDEIKADREPEAGAYLERLNDQQRLELLREQKERSMDEERARVLPEYRANRESYRDEALARREFLGPRLFHVESSEALSRALTASEEELRRMLRGAAKAGSKDLARAVFVAAEEQGFGDLMAEYFDTVDPQARDLYSEWQQAPSPEVLERQIESVEQIVHRPSVDELMPGPRVGAY